MTEPLLPARTAREWGETDRKYVWHPFTQMQTYVEEEPVVIVGGEGSYLLDADGRSYLDGVSSLWVTIHGHAHPVVNGAIQEQLRVLAHSTMLGLTNPLAALLAEELVTRTPAGLTKVFFSDNGSTAMEIAIKMAYQYWQQNPARGARPKHTFLSLREGYHGDTLGAVAVGGIELFHAAYKPLVFETHQVDPPYCYRCPWGQEPTSCRRECEDAFAHAVAEHADELAAVCIEPIVMGAGGMLVHPPGYLRRVREVCTEHDVLLICDEVAVAFGRTGTMFGCEHEGVTPDLMALAKGLTAGYLPLGATLTTTRVFAAFCGDHTAKRTFFHGHSYTGNQLGCAAALANLRVFDEEHVLERVGERAALLRDLLAPLADEPHVGEIRQRGLMVGIELVADRATKAPYDFVENIGHRVILEARRAGVILRPLGNVIVLMPHLSFTPDELRRLVAVTHRAIATVTRGAADS